MGASPPYLIGPHYSGDGCRQNAQSGGTPERTRKAPSCTWHTCRIPMATTIAGRMEHLGFKSYKDIPGTSINSYKRLVCEIESLHRLHRSTMSLSLTRRRRSAVTSYETTGETSSSTTTTSCICQGSVDHLGPPDEGDKQTHHANK